jgi:hypothetical protein
MRTPPAIWYSIKSCKRFSSIAPLAVKGVTMAVAQPRSQSSFNVIVISFSHKKAQKAQNEEIAFQFLNLIFVPFVPFCG